MNAALKLIIGLVLIAIGLVLLGGPLIGYPVSVPFFQTNLGGWIWLFSLIIVLAGVIPLFLILIGIFVVWLESEELRASKEFVKLEAKPRRAPRRRKRR